MNEKKFILDFIKKHMISVVSTVSPENMPEAAVVEFAETDNFELIFDTSNTFRKYKNLSTNPNVAFVIGWDEDITVQYEGIAEEIRGEELKKCKEIYFKKNPDAQKWEKFEDIVYFKVKPKWLRYRESSNPDAAIEIKF